MALKRRETETQATLWVAHDKGEVPGTWGSSGDTIPNFATRATHHTLEQYRTPQEQSRPD